MGTTSQATGIRVESRMDRENRVTLRPERRFQNIPDPFPLQRRPAADTMTDREYTESMEERYGILAEGFF